MDNDSDSMLKSDLAIDSKIEKQLHKINSLIEKYIKNVEENEKILDSVQGKINGLDNLEIYFYKTG